MILAITVGILVAGGLYLVLERGVVRVVFGLVLISHAVNLVLLSAGGIDRRGEPLLGLGIDRATMADPLPQAFVLTAIVIVFGITIYLLTLTVAGPEERVLEEEGGDDSGSDDEEGHREVADTGGRRNEDAGDQTWPGRWHLGDTEGR